MQSPIPKFHFPASFLSLLILASGVQSQSQVSIEENLRTNPSYGSNCSGENYTSQDTFGTSLNQLLRTLTDSVATTGFSSTSVGEVYGLALCRGDLPADICRNCTFAAAQKIIKECPDKRTAITWFVACLVRYSDTEFFGVADVDDVKLFVYIKERLESEDVKARAMMYPLVTKAASEPRMYAAEARQQEDGTFRYGMAQCTRDLNMSQCSFCLTKAMDTIAQCCEKNQGWTALYGSCNVRYEVYGFFLTPLAPLSAPAAAPAPEIMIWQPPPTPPRPLAPQKPPGPTTRSGTNTRRIVLIICSTMVTLVLGFLALFLWQKRRKLDEELRTYSNEMTLMDLGSFNEEGKHELPQFTLKALHAATNNFSKENMLGKGGFGPVYRGELNGRIVAVKKLSQSSMQGLKEFVNEIVLIAKLQHKNLVRLLGCCLEKGEKMLVYEFMPNGSLDNFLNDFEKRKFLEWEKRFSVIVGTARGLLYLHQDSRLNVIHRDLKAANILLDEQMTAKISDFGMARIFTGENDPKATNLIVGTHGYMAPEYAMDGIFSPKSDVYSFGVLLLEIVSGQTNNAFHLSQIGHSMVGYAWIQWSKGRLSELIDPVLGESHSVINQMVRCIHIALLCVQEDPTNRPNMSTVLHMLGTDSLPIPSPKQPPAFFAGSIADLSNPSTRREMPV